MLSDAAAHFDLGGVNFLLLHGLSTFSAEAWLCWHPHLHRDEIRILAHPGALSLTISDEAEEEEGLRDEQHGTPHTKHVESAHTGIEVAMHYILMKAAVPRQLIQLHDAADQERRRHQHEGLPNLDEGEEDTHIAEYGRDDEDTSGDHRHADCHEWEHHLL